MKGDAEIRTGEGIAARERLAQLGEISAEIAHELRNVLQVLSSSAFVARALVAKGDAEGAEPHLRKIERNARAAQDVVDDLLALARGDALIREWVPMSQAITFARESLDHDAARWCDLAAKDDVAVFASPRLFARMLRILYENAIQASAPRIPTITTRATVNELASGVVIEVADDGPGVPEAIAASVFEPLVSARPGGSGLGLALARRMAEAHRGTLTLEPSCETGARFRIELFSS